MKDSIDIWREGLVTYRYRSFGELYRARNEGNFMVLPVPGVGRTLGEGYAFTKRGANRKAKRSLKYGR